ncbi:MAG: serine hydrolase [Gemmatimonadaceae bacterium]|nr:serine hydrolase [Gemmatimonadaceae bacterium]
MRWRVRFTVPRVLLVLLVPVAISAGGATRAVSAQNPARGANYYPGPDGRWDHRRPQQVGMDSARVAAAVDFALARESKAPRDLLLAHLQSFGREPYGDAVGPFTTRGNPTGIIVRRGYIVAEWGDPRRVDMTFSVTKSFLSTVVGVAFDRGLIPDINRAVHTDLAPIVTLSQPSRSSADIARGDPTMIQPFETPHNRRITWNDLLRQTSDWEGSLWGKPDWADRPDTATSSWLTRARKSPGSSYEYNDVRVNALALAALNVWRRPLPRVLAEYVMDPIGASTTWRWYGYDNSWIVLDGTPVQSVSGGGHWGGGMFISAYDQARFGLLTLRRGMWGGRRILSERWVQMALTPTPAQPDYGFMNWFLNTGRKRLPSAPASAFMHLGNGTNMIYVDAEHDLVIVARWIENSALDGLVSRVLAAIE